MSERLNHVDSVSVLADVLHTMRMRGTIFFRSSLAAPWGMSLEATALPRFHVSIRGNCIVGTTDGETVKVGEMDIVMLPHGQEHWIADQAGRSLVKSEVAGAACLADEPLFQDGDVTHHLLCGVVRFDADMSHPILESLPGVLHLGNVAEKDPIWLTVRAIDTEMRYSGGRGGPIIDTLTEALTLQLFRQCQERHHPPVGFLAALADRRVAQVLALMHAEPDSEWSLTTLGERCGMSRATLVRRFESAIGQPPMTYLNNWRLLKAYSLIRYSAQSLEQIANQVGYGSARTLNRAFQRRFGKSPIDLRNISRTSPIETSGNFHGHSDTSPL